MSRIADSPGPPAMKTTGSGCGFPDAAGTIATASRMVRLSGFERFSGTTRYPHRAACRASMGSAVVGQGADSNRGVDPFGTSRFGRRERRHGQQAEDRSDDERMCGEHRCDHGLSAMERPTYERPVSERPLRIGVDRRLETVTICCHRRTQKPRSPTRRDAMPLLRTRPLRAALSPTFRPGTIGDNLVKMILPVSAEPLMFTELRSASPKCRQAQSTAASDAERLSASRRPACFFSSRPWGRLFNASSAGMSSPVRPDPAPEIEAWAPAEIGRDP